MDGALDSRTSVTLLGRLRRDGTDQAAWGEFVRRYGPKICAWCRQWALQDADAQDAAQDVLLKLAAKLRTFTYDPTRSFRGWLKTLTNHAWRDFVDARHRSGTLANARIPWEQLESQEAGLDLIQRLDEEFDRELADEAMARVQVRVAPHTWDAFRLTAIEELAGAEVARRLNMSVAMVFIAKSRVQKMIRAEVERLEGSRPS
ncbi:MAG TPA: sigma-70 family RNA polymerase sigma factor [Gemmataceae bacterium]|nr:sigma-70 family RNA polymerase sigma factor [Gemmataceae bacterium]